MTDKFSTTVRRVRGQERAALQDEERLRAVPGGRRRLDQEESRRLPQEQGEYHSLLRMGRCCLVTCNKPSNPDTCCISFYHGCHETTQRSAVCFADVAFIKWS